VNVEQAAYAESECSDKYPCNDDVTGWEARMRVPPGFAVNYFARVDDNPTSLTFGPDDDLYVAARSGTIYRVDQQGQVSEYYSGLTVPTGIAFQPGTDKLFVSSRVTDANFDGEAKLSMIEDGQETTLFDGLPCCYVGMHGPNGIAFGPDGYGYVGVGGRSDHGEILAGERQGQQNELLPLEASILRFAPDGSSIEAYARGFRNPYDIAWDGQGQLYATDNGRDGNPLVDDLPPDELHLVTPGGEHGYPWYECPVCFSAPEGVEVIPPLFELPVHSAATGITAYHQQAFPGYYDDLFLILWSAFEGAQNVLRVDAGRQQMSVFATGFAQPIDITVGPDGNLYVIDYATGIIFQIVHVE
jgi:glucose/arabinose dehydrogenase